MKTFWRKSWPILIVAGTLLYLFREAIFPPFSAWVLSREAGDVSTLYYYWRHFGFESLREGFIPLWNPFIFCGVPFAAYPESALFYPPNLIFLLLPLARALNWSFIIHLAGLAFFQYLFLRWLDSGRWASILGALTLVLGAPVILHITAGHLSNLCSMAWLPILFLTAASFARRKRPVWAVALGVGGGLQILAGHWQYVFYSAIWIFIFLIYAFLTRRDFKKSHWITLATGTAAAALVAFGLTAIQVVPALSLAEESFRKTLDYRWAATFSLPPINLLTVLSPSFLGDSLRSLYWGRNYFWEMCGYIGLIPLGLAISGLLLRRRRFSLFFALMAVGSLVLALGGYTPLFRGLYLTVPGFRYFRGSAKFLFFFAFAVSVLAARGVDCLGRAGRMAPGKPRRSRLRIAILALAGLFLIAGTAGLALSLQPSRRPPEWWRDLLKAELLRGRHYEFIPPGRPGWWEDLVQKHPPDAWPVYVEKLVETTPFPDNSWAMFVGGGRRFGLAAAAFGLILLLMGLKPEIGSWAIGITVLLAAAELILWARPYLTGFDSRACRWPADVETLLESRPRPLRYLGLDPADYNKGMIYGCSSVLGYQADVPRRYLEYINRSQGLGSSNRGGQELVPLINRISPLLNLLNPRLVIAPAFSLRENIGMELLLRNRKKEIFLNPKSTSRALITSRPTVIEERERILEILSAPGFSPAETIILEESPPPRFQKSEGAGGSVNFLEYRPGFVHLEAELDRPGFLLLNDSYAPGWQAYVDGNPVRIYRANYLMRAVCLEAGRHRVEFRYRPLAFTGGFLISMGTFATLFLVGLVSVLRRRKTE